MIRLRRARLDDAERLLAWRNDPQTRAMSRETAAVARPDHEAWLRRVLGDPGCILLIGEAEGLAAGMLRFDPVAEDGRAAAWEVSIALNPDLRGRGLGGTLLAAGLEWLRSAALWRPVYAAVRDENAASRRLFERAAFALLDVEAGWRRYLRAR